MTEANGYPSGISWCEDPERPGVFHLNVHRDGWDIEVMLTDDDGVDFWAAKKKPRIAETVEGLSPS